MNPQAAGRASTLRPSPASQEGQRPRSTLSCLSRHTNGTLRPLPRTSLGNPWLRHWRAPVSEFGATLKSVDVSGRNGLRRAARSTHRWRPSQIIPCSPAHTAIAGRLARPRYTIRAAPREFGTIVCNMARMPANDLRRPLGAFEWPNGASPDLLRHNQGDQLTVGPGLP